MTVRAIAILLVVACLLGLIAYSQFRPEPNRVSGFIEADEIRVGSRVGGRVEAIHAAEGDRVRSGQLLVELEPYDLLEQENEALQTLAAREAEYNKVVAGNRSEEIAQAKARYDQFVAQHELLVAGPRQQDIDAGRGRLRVAQAELTLAEDNFKRRSELFENGAISREELDETRERLESAQALVSVRENEWESLRLGSREEEIRSAHAQVEEAKAAWQLAEKGFRTEEIEEARAARDAAQAALDVIREQKKELSVTSPVDGVIEALDLQKGDLVAAGAPMLSILDDSNLWVRAYIPQNRVGLQIGQQVWVTVDSFGNERIPGEVTFIAREAEFTPSNVQTIEERSKQVFRIKVTLTEGLDKLRPEMTADVWLDSVGGSP